MQNTADPHDLNRFLTAQAPVYDRVLSEIKSGRKRTHWMWFVFPQLDGLGYSTTAKHYAIKSRDEAAAFLGHPVLGARLLECSEAVMNVNGRTVSDIFGYPDDIKLHSCVTLFAAVSSSPSVFDRILAKYFNGLPDEKTVELLGKRA